MWWMIGQVISRVLFTWLNCKVYSPPVPEEVAVEGRDTTAGAVEPGVAEAAEVSGMEPTRIGVAGASSAQRVELAWKVVHISRTARSLTKSNRERVYTVSLTKGDRERECIR